MGEQMTEPKRKRGRPPGSTKPDEEKMISVRLTIRPDQRDDLDRLGGSAWVREKIDEARIRREKSKKKRSKRRQA
jgi:hypothetical protein